jgi:outer membrane PBP1 activator LpoA protein
MLHVSLRSGQICARPWLAAGMLVLLVALTTPAFAQEGAAAAEALVRSGRHLEAAAQYEKLARRGFFSWDVDYLLLAAREYGAAGEFDDAERLLARARDRLREPEERLLAARVEAEIALARGDAARALGAFRGLPEPLPDDIAPDLLALRARAEFSVGMTVQGLRTLEERGRLLTAPAARAANDKFLLDQLLLHPPTFQAMPPGLSERERGWLELVVLLPASRDPLRQGDPSLAQQLRDWVSRHPGHPGIPFLPGADAFVPGAGLAALPSAAPATIAVLLPLSGKQQAAGAAVRDGIAAGWFASGPAAGRPRLAVFDTAAGGVVAAYERAVAEGAQLVIGPLLREDVVAVVNARQGMLPVPTLALNSLGLLETAPPPTFLVQFSLDPEQEARAIARRIAADGLAHGIALFPDSTWGQRVREAFVSELAATGSVTLTSAQYYGLGEQDYAAPLRAALGRFGGAGVRSSDTKKPAPLRNAAAERAAGPQFAFIAATPQTARAIRPQLRFQMTYDLPIYATSDAWDPSVRTVADLDGLVFPEMPWILHSGQGAPELWDAIQQEWSALARGRVRLYAFGYDAYRLALQLRGNASFIGVSGLTGTLTVGHDGHVQRSLEFARVEGGTPRPAMTNAPSMFLPEPAVNAPGTSPPR